MEPSTFSESLLPDTPGIIALVGAGGKTSLMFKLASEITTQEQTVLTTTTTKIFKPDLKQCPCTLCTDKPLEWLRQKKEALNPFQHITLAKREVANKKLQGFEPETIDALWRIDHFDWILVEADGAAGRPLKAPADHEPVIPSLSQSVVAVLGLQGFNKPLVEDWLFRPDILSLMTGRKTGQTISFMDLIQVLTHEKGLFKGSPNKAEKSIYLNQADNQERLDLGNKFVQILKESCPLFLGRYAIGSLYLSKIFKA